MKTRGRQAQRLALVIAGAALFAFLLLPLIALFATSGSGGFVRGLMSPRVLPALRLSLQTTIVSLTIAVVLGTPLAWILARSRSRFAFALETLVQVPMVVPPAVAGVALLLTFGSRGTLAMIFQRQGASLSFTTTAVVFAELFVSAPFYLQAAVSAFRSLDERLLVVARTFGATPWRVLLGVAVPLARPALVSGALMTWARSLGEFGATLMFAGNLEGRTQTLPLAIYTALESDLATAQSLSIVLVCVAFALLLAARTLSRADVRAEPLR
jgi:molybdate transport system permease protein